MTTKSIDPSKLFIASCIALLVTGMTFSIRAGLLNPLGLEFGLNNTELATIASAAFLGFPLAVILGGFIVDIVGMGRLLIFALIGHILGIILTIFAGGFWSLYISTLLVGIANGLVEAACNPLVATLYPNDKTKMLNRFHIFFPFGIVFGGLVVYFMKEIGLGWQIQMASMLVPAAVYAFLFLGHSFPPTERVASGVSYGEMFKECLRPLFLFMIFCMFLSASTELATNQLIEKLLSNVALLLVFINSIMAVGRIFAGPVVHRLAPTGILLFSAIFSAIGLFWLSRANGSETYIAAAVFAMGICYFWPTMLGFTSEYLPKTGAIGLSLMGGAGMFSVSLVLPLIGIVMDKKIATLTQGYSLKVLQKATEGSTEYDIWKSIETTVGITTLQYINILPVILIIAFVGLILYTRQMKSKPTLVKTA
ncbi:MAG: MFS transporter [Bacteroidota bacterium]